MVKLNAFSTFLFLRDLPFKNVQCQKDFYAKMQSFMLYIHWSLFNSLTCQVQWLKKKSEFQEKLRKHLLKHSIDLSPQQEIYCFLKSNNKILITLGNSYNVKKSLPITTFWKSNEVRFTVCSLIHKNNLRKDFIITDEFFTRKQSHFIISSINHHPCRLGELYITVIMLNFPSGYRFSIENKYIIRDL